MRLLLGTLLMIGGLCGALISFFSNIIVVNSSLPIIDGLELSMGRKLLAEKDFMEIEVIPNELTKYMNTLNEVIDVGIGIELNILKDWIELGDKGKLKDRLDTLRDLGLKYSFRKLQAIV